MSTAGADARPVRQSDGSLMSRALWWGIPAVLVLVTLLLRLPLLDRIPHVDEFFHVITAQSILDDGDLITMGGVPYSRGWLFTYAVAGSFALFGESFVVGRLVPLAFAIFQVLALFLVVRRYAGTLAGCAAAIPLMLDPLAVQLAQFVRFYTLHAFLFWIGAWSAYAMVDEVSSTRRRVMYAVLAIVSFLGALHLQLTTLIGLMGVGLWVTAVIVYRIASTRREVPEVLRRSAVVTTGAVLGAAIVVGVLMLAFVPPLRTLVGGLNYVPQWAASLAGDSRVYARMLRDTWPLLWLAFPLLAVGALRLAPRAASFGLTVFSVAFMLHTVAAWKSDRYLYYALPFFFLVCGMGISWFARAFVDATSRLVASIAGGRLDRHASVLGSALVLLAMGFALVQMPAVVRTQKWLRQNQPIGPDGAPGPGRPDWGAATDSIAPYIARHAAVHASSDVKAVYYLDQVDGYLHLPEPLDPSPADTLSPYTGRPRLFTVDRFLEEMSRRELSVLVIEDAHWRTRHGVSDELADVIEASARSVPVPERWRLRIFVWGDTPHAEE